MYPSVIEITPTDEYCLYVSFNTGERGVLDMRPFLDFGVFRNLKHQTAFRQVRVSFNTIEWLGAIDLDPVTSHINCEQDLTLLWTPRCLRRTAMVVARTFACHNCG